MREDAHHEADALRLLGVDDLAGEDHLHRTAEADELRQVARAAGLRDESGGHGDLAELGPVRGVADVAGGGELKADADGRAVDRRDGDARELFELADRALDDDVAQVVEEVVGEFLVRAEIAEVVLLVERAEGSRLRAKIAAGGEAAALAGDDDDTQPIVAADLVEQEVELDAHAHVDGVQRLRPVQRDDTDAGIVRLAARSLDRPFQGLEGEHRRFLISQARRT